MNSEALKRAILKYETLTVGGFLLLILILSLFSPQSELSYPQFFEVKKGDTLSKIAANLNDSGFMRHSFLFKSCAFFLGGSRGLNAGVYEFEKPLGVCSLAFRIVNGNYSIHPIKMTFPEGLLKTYIADKLKALPRFDREHFLATAPEGRLFPDAYFLNPNINETDII